MRSSQKHLTSAISQANGLLHAYMSSSVSAVGTFSSFVIREAHLEIWKHPDGQAQSAAARLAPCRQ